MINQRKQQQTQEEQKQISSDSTSSSTQQQDQPTLKTRSYCKWSQQEQHRLRKIIQKLQKEKQRANWDDISQQFQGKTTRQVYDQYMKMLKNAQKSGQKFIDVREKSSQTQLSQDFTKKLSQALNALCQAINM